MSEVAEARSSASRKGEERMNQIGQKLKCATSKCKRQVKWWFGLDNWCEKDYRRVKKLREKKSK